MAKSDRVAMCFRCKHYLKNTSCGSCVDKNNAVSENLKHIASKRIVKIEKNTPLNDEFDEMQKLKYACKVIMNDPSDFDEVNPLQCKYFFPKSVNIRF